ncbi:Gag polyprotein, partial [Bienertia sinuspersici]
MKNSVEELFDVKYERPPLFYFFCGKVGHRTKDCDNGSEEVASEVKFGVWLKASPWKPSGSSEQKKEFRMRNHVQKLFLLLGQRRDQVLKKADVLVEKDKETKELSNSQIQNLCPLTNASQDVKEGTKESKLPKSNEKERKWKRLIKNHTKSIGLGESMAGEKRNSREVDARGYECMTIWKLSQ